MNYIYFHIGKIPNYFNYSVKSILNVDSNAQIHLITDQNYINKKIEVHNTKTLQNENIEYINNLNYFNDFNKNPLWHASLLRIFYLESLIFKFNLKENVHFDSDVVIFKSFNDIKNLFSENKLNITPLKHNELVFGYSYLKTFTPLKKITQELIRIYSDSEKYEKIYFNGKILNEMKSLFITYDKLPQMFHLLNTEPVKNKLIFDPASYGQNLFGTHNKFFSKGFIDETHICSKYLKNNKTRLYVLDKIPEMIYNGKKYEFVNLHMHSKKLSKVVK